MKKMRIKWGNVIMLGIAVICIALILKDTYMLTIYSYISGKTIGLTFKETMKLHPLELERMVEMYINLEKLKGGK